MTISYNQWIDYMFWKSYGSGIPLSGNFELTARCNLDCKMCYIHKKENDVLVRSKELTTEQWISMAEQAQEKGMLLVLLTGGEPFIRPDFKEIYSACRKLGLLVSINTNGTMLTEQMVEFLKSDPPRRINITLYGASRETYETLCGDGNAYDRVCWSIQALKEAGINVKLNYSVTPQNIQDAEAIYQFAKENDLFIQTATYMFPPVRACEHGHCEIQRLTPKEAAGARWEYDKVRFNTEQLMNRAKELLAGNSVEDPDKECQELPTERIRCRAGSTTFWMTYDGQMRPCGMMQVPSVDAMEIGFEEAWAQIRQEREKIMIPAKCTACSMKNACEFCPATCYAENSSFEISPEYICEKTKAYLQFAREWLQAVEGEE